MAFDYEACKWSKRFSEELKRRRGPVMEEVNTKEEKLKDLLELSKKVAETYGQIWGCCNLLSRLAEPDEDAFTSVAAIIANPSGLKFSRCELKAAGIDVSWLYACVEEMARTKKLELERELGALVPPAPRPERDEVDFNLADKLKEDE